MPIEYREVEGEDIPAGFVSTSYDSLTCITANGERMFRGPRRYSHNPDCGLCEEPSEYTVCLQQAPPEHLCEEHFAQRHAEVAAVIEIPYQTYDRGLGAAFNWLADMNMHEHTPSLMAAGRLGRYLNTERQERRGPMEILIDKPRLLSSLTVARRGMAANGDGKSIRQVNRLLSRVEAAAAVGQ